MEWQVIKMANVETLAIHKIGAIDLYDYEVLEQHETEQQAYKAMHDKAKELNIHGMKYKHLEQ